MSIHAHKIKRMSTKLNLMIQSTQSLYNRINLNGWDSLDTNDKKWLGPEAHIPHTPLNNQDINIPGHSAVIFENKKGRV